MDSFGQLLNPFAFNLVAFLPMVVGKFTASCKFMHPEKALPNSFTESNNSRFSGNTIFLKALHPENV